MVSVVIPCYNQAAFLPDAVGSVVAQRYAGWELIIVDDGSSDATPRVARELVVAGAGRRLRALRQPNRGVAAARNLGARYAAGGALLFLDADDMLAPDMLARGVAALEARPEVGFVYSGMQLFGDDRHTWPGVPFDLRLLALDNIVPPHALVRRAAFVEAGGFDASVAQGFADWELWLRLAGAGWQGLCLPEPLIYYRRHAASMSSAGLPRAWDTRAQLALRHPALYGPRVRAWAARRCALRRLSARPRPADSSAGAVRELAAAWGSEALPPGPMPPIPYPARVRLRRRLLRALPYPLRLRARWALRRAQLALRASGFWP